MNSVTTAQGSVKFNSTTNNRSNAPGTGALKDFAKNMKAIEKEAKDLQKVMTNFSNSLKDAMKPSQTFINQSASGQQSASKLAPVTIPKAK